MLNVTESAPKALKADWAILPKTLRFLIIIVLAIGILLRVVHLDQKIYWNDEVFTSLRISGYTVAEVERELGAVGPIGSKDLQKYQQISANKTVIDTVKGLAIEEPQLPPLYFVLVRGWAKLWGSSTIAVRSFSAFTGILILPALYLLCRELFSSILVGALATCFVAVSPFFLLYSQAARQYSLWALLIVLSCWAFLRAVRLQRPAAWALYAITVSLSLYTFLYSLFVTISHGLYLALLPKSDPRRKLKPFGIAAGIGILAAIPWGMMLLTYSSSIKKQTGWLNYLPPGGIPELFFRWLRNLRRIFIDYSLVEEDPINWILAILVLALTGYAFYYLARTAPKSASLFIFSLVSVTALVLMVPDLLLKSQRSGIIRYLTTCYLGVVIAVAYLFSSQITVEHGRLKPIWKVGFAGLLSIAILSCWIGSSAQIWWNNGPSKVGPVAATARLLNQSANPLVIGETPEWHTLIPLSYSLDDRVKLQLVSDPQNLTIPAGYSDYFLYQLSKKFRQEVEKRYTVNPVKGIGGSALLKLQP